MLCPGMPRLKLKQDIMERYQPAGTGKQTYYVPARKYQICIREAFSSRPVPLTHIFQLAVSPGYTGIKKIPKMEAVRILIENTYRHQIANQMHRQPLVFKSRAAIADAAHCFQFYRTWNLKKLDDAVQTLINCLSGA